MDDFKFPVLDNKKTGERIKAVRIQNGYSVRELQEVLGFTTPQAIYKWQWGESIPDVQNLLAIAKLFHVTIDSLLVTEEEGGQR